MTLDRPSWDDQLLSQAFLIAQRSPDRHTKCGCVITDSDHKVLGQGFNGFPRGVDDNALPLERPDKYKWMIHAEVNAILNCDHRPEKATAYITTEPCLQCMILMWQSGIKEVVFSSNGPKPRMTTHDPSYELDKNLFLDLSRMSIRSTEVDLSHVRNMLEIF